MAMIGLSGMKVLALCGQGHPITKAPERRRMYRGLGKEGVALGQVLKLSFDSPC